MQQQMNMQNNVNMAQPPEMVSTKDALYLTDMLSWNLLAMKKAHFFASQCQDQEIINAIERAGQMHQRHYQQILNHLQPNAHLQ
ncbi:hypothetical protein EDD69_11287 [Thermolongibacillus altinsuensis]|jgi:hypothetical protein|uniref:Coat F domain-containing protein n=1 Tax=Thermolongibacillus altinsuensis TaxID=575256 RepID=A0A4R1QK95_9BACL|nr:hypothetical protein [Thermolongibacillus altinsuensis]TCL47376.1 hypothetical protein EDD69_11287 [Thermolongibacillus altinsuensis]GMB09060.1 hypothetical protein B1no1_17700 [Thermolongibacillus altinsuensis]